MPRVVAATGRGEWQPCLLLFMGRMFSNALVSGDKLSPWSLTNLMSQLHPGPTPNPGLTPLEPSVLGIVWTGIYNHLVESS